MKNDQQFSLSLIRAAINLAFVKDFTQSLWTTTKGCFLCKNILSSFKPPSYSNSNDIEYLDFIKKKYFYLFKDIRISLPEA